MISSPLGSSRTNSKADKMASFIAQSGFSSVFNKLMTRNWLRGLRPLDAFAAKESFSMPRNFEEASTRLELNAQYFATNYAIILMVAVCLVLLMTPMLLVFAVIDGYAWFYVSTVDAIPIPYTQYLIRGKNKFYAMAGITVFFIMCLAGTSLLLVIGFGIICAGAHAVAHETMVDDQDLENGAATMTGVITDDLEDDMGTI